MCTAEHAIIVFSSLSEGAMGGKKRQPPSPLQVTIIAENLHPFFSCNSSNLIRNYVIENYKMVKF